MINIFARQITDELTSLVKQIDSVVNENKKKEMAAFFVLLTDDPDADELKLKKLADKEKIKHTPLTTFEGVAGPPKYKLSKDADVTVLMWVGSKKEVKVNHAFPKGGLTEDHIKQIVKDASKILN